MISPAEKQSCSLACMGRSAPQSLARSLINVAPAKRLTLGAKMLGFQAVQAVQCFEIRSCYPLLSNSWSAANAGAQFLPSRLHGILFSIYLKLRPSARKLSLS